VTAKKIEFDFYHNKHVKLF